MQILRIVCLIGMLGIVSSSPAQNYGPPIKVVPLHPDEPVRVSGNVMAGQLLHRVEPVYPDTGVQGTVLLRAIIGSDGTVQQLSVISGPPALEKAAMDAVRLWIYQPYLLNGEAVTVDTVVTVNFKR